MLKDRMSGKERWTAALWGKPVDRIPLWMLEGITWDPEANYAGHFTLDWKNDPKYKKMLKDFSDIIDEMPRIGIYPFNRFLLSSEKYFERKPEFQKDSDTKEHTIIVHTPKGDLRHVSEIRRGCHTTWTTEYPVKNLEDLRKLAGIPFEIDHEAMDRYYRDFRKQYSELGDRGIFQAFLSSPIVAISGCMSFETFLELSFLEKEYFHELLNMIIDRYMQVLKIIFDKYDYDAVFWFGGSEQCTPPMMDPFSFDEFVLPYDKKLIDFIKSYGKLVGCHCHGKVKHALGCMIEAGYEATDPLECPPQGDVSIDEALKIVNGKMTLLGNFEFDELENREPEYITQRTFEILKHKDKRIILSATAASVSAASDRLLNNYYAVMNAYNEVYGINGIKTLN